MSVATKPCPHCQRAAPVDANLCPYCGYQYPHPPEPQPLYSQPVHQGLRPMLWFAIISVPVCFILLLVLFYVRARMPW